MTEFKYVGRHADELDGGRPIAPGEYTGPIELGEEGSHNSNLAEAGLLIEVEDGTAEAVQKADEAAQYQSRKDRASAAVKDANKREAAARLGDSGETTTTDPGKVR